MTENFVQHLQIVLLGAAGWQVQRVQRWASAPRALVRCWSSLDGVWLKTSAVSCRLGRP